MAKVKGLSAAVMKAIGIFSGVQVLQILCSMVRTKLVALWIGAAGVGLFGLYYSALDLINTVSQLSLRNSVVPEIVAANHTSRLSRLVLIVRRWCIGLGIIGAFLTLALSPLLSRLTFGDTSHTLGFIFLSINVFLNSVLNSELSIMQGLNRLKLMAQASMWGAVAGLVASVPLFYYLRIDSIVPSFIAYGIATAGAAWALRCRVPRPKPGPNLRQTINEGLSFVRLGVYLTISAFVSLASSYIFRAYLNFNAGIDAVGFYQAAYTLVNSYIGLLFSAISMEYYPRLCSVTGHHRRTSLFVSHETGIAMLVILPVATIFMAMDDVVIRLLYSSEFLIAAPLVAWALVGTVFRAVSWCMAFEILARGDGRIYIITETLSGVLYIVVNIAGWHLGGYTGLGIAYLAWYVAYTLIVWVVYRYRYNLSIAPGVVALTLTTTAVTTICAFALTHGSRLTVIIIAAISTLICLRSLSRLIFKSR